MRNHFLILLILPGVLMMGCQKQINPDVYSGASVGEASLTYRGVIHSARYVQVGGADRLDQNTTGMAVGALTGAAVGSQFGKGSGNTATTIGGALLGGMIGAQMQQSQSQQMAIEYIVDLNNGQTMTVVQGTSPALRPGQQVMVIVSHQGRSRVVPR